MKGGVICTRHEKGGGGKEIIFEANCNTLGEFVNSTSIKYGRDVGYIRKQTLDPGDAF